MPDQQDYFNQAAASLAAQVAAQAAQLAFQRERFEKLELPQFSHLSATDKEKLAFQKATEVWNQAFQEASVTGSYNGVPAAQFLLSASQVTGQFNQPGQLNEAQQAQYQSLQQQISTAQQQLMTLAPGTPEYNTVSTNLAAYRAQLAPLQQVLQGTNKPATPTMAGQNQTFQQQMALAAATGIVPTGTTPWGVAPAAEAGAGGLPIPTSGEKPPEGVSVADWLKARQGGQAGQWVWQADAGNYVFMPGTDGPPIVPSAAPPAGGAPGAGAPGAAAGGQQTMAYTQMLAALTGMFNGQPTPEYQQMLAALTGTFNGQPTQAAMEFAKQFGLSEAAVTGMYNGQPTQAAQEFAKQFGLSEAAVTGMYQGSPTQAAKEFEANLKLQQQQFGLSEAGVTGYYQGADTLARTQMENDQANQMLQLAASLRGPRNAFQFAKVLGGTPGGLSDILGSVMGRYQLPGFQGGGAAPEAVNLQNFMQDTYAATPQGGSMLQTGGVPAYRPQTPISGGGGDMMMPDAGTPRPGGYQLPTYAPQMNQWSSPGPSYTVNPPGAQAPTNAYNYQPTGDGSQTVYPPGISAPVQAGQVSSPSPMSGANLQQIGAQAMAQQPYMLPNPSQFNAESYNNLGTYRQDLLKAQYENAGWDIGAFEEQFKQSLPTYSGPKVGKVAGIV